MHPHPGYRFLFSLYLLLFSQCLFALDINNPREALEAYIQKDDGKFSYQHIISVPANGLTLHLYNMVSQEWRSSDEIDRTLWQHQLVIAVPDNVSTTTGMLFIGDNDNTSPLPDSNDIIIQIISQLAIGSQTIVSAVYQIPNQPFFFPDANDSFKEDRLVGYSWDKYLDTGDTTWPIHVPMTKSVIKAMDAVQLIAPSLGAYQVDDFVLTGYSKRGLVTWLAGAIDPRVKAIAPGVIDFLNVIPSMENQFKSYGAYVEVLQSLVDMNVLGRLRSPEFKDLASIIDPYEYRDRLTMPKLLLNASGDQFFLPDSAKFYFNDLPGEKLIRYAPNAGHSLQNSVTSIFDTLYSLLGWYQTLLLDIPRPEINWQLENNQIVANTTQPPQFARVWRATNDNARDFRITSIGESWQPEFVFPDANGEYRATLAQPANGYAASYIEFVYQGPAGLPMSFSSQVYITPDSYPFTLYQAPIVDPENTRYWRQQLAIARNSDNGEVSLAAFESYVPVPVFDNYFSDIDALTAGFSKTGGSARLSKNAQAQCLATRMNLSDQRIGWYSEVDFGIFGTGPLWQFYQIADSAAEHGYPLLAGSICYQLNQQ